MDILVQEGKEHKESEEFVPLENIGMMQNLKQNYGLADANRVSKF